MSLKKIILKTFLILALGCFGASSAFAATTHVFYKDLTGTNQCDFGYSAFCATAFARVPRKSQYRYIQEGCDYFGYSEINVRYSETSPSYGSTGLYYDDAAKSINHVTSAQKMTHTCNDGEKFELIGCTPQCVVDPCKPLKDQQFSGSSECGSWSCDSGVLTGGSCNGKVVLSGGASSATKQQCTGTLVSSDTSRGFYKTSDNGKSSGVAYCSATYKYTGTSASQNDVPLDLSALALSKAVPMPDNGICPPDKPQPTTINGIASCIDNKLPDSECPIAGEKPNSTGLCVPPDDPTYPKDTDPTKPDPKVGCDVGKIKNASGVCVPYADATKCKVGEIRSNTGICTVDPKATKCEQGQVKNASGACVTDPKGTGCKNDALPDKLGVCPTGESACSTGQVRDASGACVGKNPNAPPDGTGCKDGSTPNAQGVCADGSGACSPGKVRSSSGACVLDTSEGNTSGSSSSNCETAPECGGDPLQCASLEQIWRSGCDQIKAMSEISQEDADKMASAASAAKTEGESHQAAVDSQAEGFFSDFETKANAVSNSAQCISDASFSVMGKSLVVPFSQACPFFKFLRLLVLFSAYMLSARILFGGVS